MKECKCGNPVEAAHYQMCYDCWWKQDPRNVKNGGTVDLEKHKMIPSVSSDQQSFSITEIRFVNKPRSLNSRFILEAYAGDRSLKARETSGFAMLAQKVSLIALKVLVDTQLPDGTFIPAGFKAYVKEEMVFTQPWGKNNMECADITGKFIIVPQEFIEFVVPA